jgi:hypothetical protein
MIHSNRPPDTYTFTLTVDFTTVAGQGLLILSPGYAVSGPFPNPTPPPAIFTLNISGNCNTNAGPPGGSVNCLLTTGFSGQGGGGGYGNTLLDPITVTTATVTITISGLYLKAAPGLSGYTCGGQFGYSSLVAVADIAGFGTSTFVSLGPFESPSYQFEEVYNYTQISAIAQYPSPATPPPYTVPGTYTGGVQCSGGYSFSSGGDGVLIDPTPITPLGCVLNAPFDAWGGTSSDSVQVSANVTFILPPGFTYQSEANGFGYAPITVYNSGSVFGASLCALELAELFGYTDYGFAFFPNFINIKSKDLPQTPPTIELEWNCLNTNGASGNTVNTPGPHYCSSYRSMTAINSQFLETGESCESSINQVYWGRDICSSGGFNCGESSTALVPGWHMGCAASNVFHAVQVDSSNNLQYLSFDLRKYTGGSTIASGVNAQSAQIAWSPISSTLTVAFDDNAPNVWICESSDQGDSWGTPIKIVSGGTWPAIAIHPISGDIYIAVNQSGTWNVYKKQPGDTAYASVSTITSLTANRAALEFDTDKDYTLYFTTSDGANIWRYTQYRNDTDPWFSDPGNIGSGTGVASAIDLVSKTQLILYFDGTNYHMMRRPNQSDSWQDAGVIAPGSANPAALEVSTGDWRRAVALYNNVTNQGVKVSSFDLGDAWMQESD